MSTRKQVSRITLLALCGARKEAWRQAEFEANSKLGPTPIVFRVRDSPEGSSSSARPRFAGLAPNSGSRRRSLGSRPKAAAVEAVTCPCRQSRSQHAPACG